MTGPVPLEQPVDLEAIDLLVPHYGDRALLERTVASVLAQADPRWRLHVVDDNPPSVDQGLDRWFDGLGDPRVTYTRNLSRLGIAGNFQRCLDLAWSDRVVFPGCDDELMPSYVGLVRDALRRHPEATAVLPGVRVIDETGEPSWPLTDRVKSWLALSSGEPVGGERLAVSLMRGNWTYFPAICWDRRAIARHGFRHDLPITLDLALLVDVVLEGGTLLRLDEDGFRYRRHAASLSSVGAGDLARFAEEADLFAECADRFTAAGWSRATRAARLHLTSRLHAATRLPGSLRTGDRSRVRAALTHLGGRGTARVRAGA